MARQGGPPAGETGPSRAIARHIASVESVALSDSAMAAARRSLMDAVGVSLAASGMEPACDAFVPLDESIGPCTLIGRGNRAGVLAAAFANGALAHAIDFEDVLDAAPIHPNACTVAAALAVAEARGRVSGVGLLSSIAIGADIVCRLSSGLRANPEAAGWYTPALLGAFGACAAAARLLKLEAAQIEHALALTLIQGACTSEFKRTPGSNLRAVRDAFGAEAGVRAALLAARGVKAFERPIEGRAGLYAQFAGGAWDEPTLLHRLGEQWLGEDVTFKAWPSCRGTHAAIEAALELRGRIAADEVERVVVSATAFVDILFSPRASKIAPTTAIEAKFSIPFCFASAFLHGEPDLDAFDDAALRDPRVLTLAQRVAFEPTQAPPASADAAIIEVLTTSGENLRVEVLHALGHPSNPLSDERLRQKFVACAARARHAPEPAEASTFMSALDELSCDRSDLGSRILGLLQGEKASV